MSEDEELEEGIELVEEETATAGDEVNFEYGPDDLPSMVDEKPAPAAKAKKKKADPPPVKLPEKIVNPLLGEPYDFDRCTVALQIVFLPDDGDPRGREVVVGARSHNIPPSISVFRMRDVWPMKPSVESVLTELRQTIADCATMAAAMAAAQPVEVQAEVIAEEEQAVEAVEVPAPPHAPVKAKPAPQPVVEAAPLPPAHPREDLPPVANAKQIDLFNQLFGA